jgi:putative ABC transport system ATP-binding protein
MFLKVKDLVKTYKTGEVETKALGGVSFSMEKGQTVTVLGPSGSGKSTLINIIGGIDTADGGSVVVGGEEITRFSGKQLTEYRRNSVGFIFQFYNLIPNLTVYENVEAVANISRSPENVADVLGSVGLGSLMGRFPRELSGGQQQRVSIARALVKKPKLLFCDEPTGALDYPMSIEILKLLEDIKKDFQTTIMIVTHNNAISGMADRVIHLRDGLIAQDISQAPVPAERIKW